MTIKEVSDRIGKNKCTQVQIEDYSGNKLDNIVCKNSSQAAGEFEDRIEDFRDYGKVQVCARENEKTTWGNAFCWQLNFKEGAKGKEIAGMPNTDSRIGAMEYITMFTTKEAELSKLRYELLEKDLQLKNNDPNRYLPIMYAAASAFGIEVKMPQMAGVTKKKGDKLISGDVLTKEEIIAKVDAEILQIAKKIKGEEFIETLEALNSIPDIKTNIEKVNKLLAGVALKPELLDMAMKFI